MSFAAEAIWSLLLEILMSERSPFALPIFGSQLNGIRFAY